VFCFTNKSPSGKPLLFTFFSSFSEYCCLLNPPPFHRPFPLLSSTMPPFLAKKEEGKSEREDLQQRVPFPTGLSLPFLDHASFPERKKRENWKERTCDKEFHPPLPHTLLFSTVPPSPRGRRGKSSRERNKRVVEWRNDH